jgi:hypothetical protein
MLRDPCGQPDLANAIAEAEHFAVVRGRIEQPRPLDRRSGDLLSSSCVDQALDPAARFGVEGRNSCHVQG